MSCKKLWGFADLSEVSEDYEIFVESCYRAQLVAGNLRLVSKVTVTSG